MKLGDGISEFIAHKKASGFSYRQGEARLREFERQMGDVQIGDITARHLVTYFNRLDSRSSNSVAKYLQLRRLFHYWQVRGETGTIAFPPKPSRVRQASGPYVYTLSEFREMLASVTSNHRHSHCLIDASTFRMYLIVLYATGATPTEALSIRRMDVSRSRRRIALHKQSYFRSREIVICDDLQVLLSEYLSTRSRSMKPSDRIFLDRLGMPIDILLATYNFRRLCVRASLHRRDGSDRSPRLLDFKTTFAVNRITAWIKEGADLNRMLPALAAYMGQSGLGTTDVYLRLTPERFNTSLKALSPKTEKTHWRDDSTLMRFLTSL